MWKAREHVTAALVQRYYNKTMELLCDNHELLVAVAKELAEKGYLLAEDIERIKERMQKTGRQERYF
jgi:ATP-dependent Zn protease